MFAITNHKVENGKTGLDQYDKTPHEKGANEVRLSRVNPGDAKCTRFGHYIKRLVSRIAHCVNLTDASCIQESNPPFAERADKNKNLNTSIHDAFMCQHAAEPPRFRAQENSHEAPR